MQTQPIKSKGGGITSVIAGGDFMDGAAGALIGYLTNHAMHGGSKLQHMAHAARVRQIKKVK